MALQIRLRTSAGKYLSYRDASDSRPLQASATPPTQSELFWLTTPNNRPRSGDIASLMTYRIRLEGAFQRATDDRHISLIDSRGRASQRLYVRYSGPSESPGNPAGDGFILTRLNNNGKPLADGDRIALRFNEDTRTPGYLSADSIGGLQLRSIESPGATETFIIEMMSDLKLFWSEARRDNFSVVDKRRLMGKMRE